MSSKSKPLVTAAVLAVTVTACSADQAILDTPTHTIGGPQRTTHREQVWEVRRAGAERTALAAKAKADAERAANPLVSIFGSQAQREAAEAQARFEQVLAEKPVRKKSAPSRTARSARPPVPRPPKRRDAALPAEVAKRAATTGALQGNPPPAASAVVIYDVASAIKTTHFPDGHVEEDSFDVATLPAIKSAAQKTASRIRIVNDAQPEAKP